MLNKERTDSVRPIIGITGNLTDIQNDDRYAPFTVSYIPHDFVKAIKAAGGIPIIIPLIRDENLSEYLEIVDGLVLTGGQDVSPIFYNEEPDLRLGSISPNRDEHEIELVEQFLNSQKPILGICRGMQIINIVLGGSLYQDLSLAPNVTVQHVQKAEVHFVTHSVSVDPDSSLGQLMKTGDYVNTIHHQAIKELGKGLKASAWSPDRLIEAVESEDGSQNIIAVQWHPELTYDINQASRSIFKNFINRSLKAREANQ
ncbi:gamma-glutamyl-gamma-aminobutyrate hydrolase family protein [Facklamia lactis]|uniref:gamma-glutamyl-gamma-aminobutyrate hydrolase family protein n=1 Tax=Facklamia lactis TaxID=2749967 RepID=UPI001C554062|nr:gamma-glutamyl-gamma-aminobutyrate hydrolase family protein [Facklamia lactis]